MEEKKMEFTINEKIIITLSIQVRRKKWLKLAQEKIQYLKEVGADITNNADLAYYVNCVNECTRIIAKMRGSYASIN